MSRLRASSLGSFSDWAQACSRTWRSLQETAAPHPRLPDRHRRRTAGRLDRRRDLPHPQPDRVPRRLNVAHHHRGSRPPTRLPPHHRPVRPVPVWPVPVPVWQALRAPLTRRVPRPCPVRCRQARRHHRSVPRTSHNLDIGRQASVGIIFARTIRRDTRGTFRTTIDRPAIGPDAGGVVLNIYYKYSRIKQYLKDGRAMPIETVVNSPRDLGCLARLHHLAELQDKAHMQPAHTRNRGRRPGNSPCEHSL
jgi:hypothetical protein